MKLFYALLTLVALSATLYAGDGWSTTKPVAPQGCSCGPDCPCGDSCACGNHSVALTSASDPFTPINRVVISAYQRAIKENRVLVIGVNRVPPSGNWLTDTYKPDANYKDGTVVVMRPGTDGKMHEVRTFGDITASQISDALNPPAPVMQQAAPMYYSAPMAAGGCSGGGQQSFGGTPMFAGNFGSGFGGFSGGGILARFAGGSCGPGGCH